jgi:hypothetical protein
LLPPTGAAEGDEVAEGDAPVVAVPWDQWWQQPAT